MRTFPQARARSGHACRTSFAVTAERYDHLTARAGKPAGECRGLARVTRQPDYPDSRVGPGNCAQHFQTAVVGTVVDEQYFVRPSQLGEGVRELRVERSQVVALVEKRDDY